MEKKKEKILPITWNLWDRVDTNALQFYDVEFIDDFGVFIKGENIECITVDFQNGIIESYNEDGTEVDKKQEFICVPKQ